MYIDTHAHMDLNRFDSDRGSILQAVKDAGVGVLVNPAITYDSNYLMRRNLDCYDWIYYGVGIRPNSVGRDDAVDEEWESGLLRLASTGRETGRVVAIGETGLDFYRLGRDENGAPDEIGIRALNRQYQWFRKQIELSVNCGLPLILHVRDADRDKASGYADAPYVVPKGVGGKRNTPLSIPFIAKIIADIRGIPVERVEEITTANAQKLFGLR